MAALLQNGEGTSVIRGGLPPLTPPAESAVACALADIEALPHFDALPVGAGPYFVMGEPRTLPADGTDPGRWVLD